MNKRTKPPESVVDRLQLAYGVRSARQLAVKLGLPPSTVGSWSQRGSTPMDVLARAAKDCRVTLGWLLEGDGPGPLDIEEAPPPPLEDSLPPDERRLLALYRLAEEPVRRSVLASLAMGEAVPPGYTYSGRPAAAAHGLLQEAPAVSLKVGGNIGEQVHVGSAQGAAVHISTGGGKPRK